jgi:hypothetical protein
MLAPQLQRVLDDNSHLGKLPTYTSIGCYPLFYLNNHNDVLCPDCANEHEDFDETITAYDANREDASLYCDHCSKRIESAYAEE